MAVSGEWIRLLGSRHLLEDVALGGFDSRRQLTLVGHLEDG